MSVAMRRRSEPGPMRVSLRTFPVQPAQGVRCRLSVRPEQGADAFNPGKKRRCVAGGEEVGAEVSAGQHTGALPFRRVAEAIELGAQKEGQHVLFRSGEVVDDTVDRGGEDVEESLGGRLLRVRLP